MLGSDLIVETDSLGPSTRVSVRGDIDVATAPRLVAALDAVIAQGPCEIVLDLRRVGLADSTGLAAFIRCRRRTARLGIDLVLEVGDGPVSRVLDMTGLSRVFTVR